MFEQSNGPFYNVETGRRDGRVSNLSLAADMPDVNDSIGQLKSKFKRKGLSDKDLVVLSGMCATPFCYSASMLSITCVCYMLFTYICLWILPDLEVFEQKPIFANTKSSIRCSKWFSDGNWILFSVPDCNIGV